MPMGTRLHEKQKSRGKHHGFNLAAAANGSTAFRSGLLTGRRTASYRFGVSTVSLLLLVATLVSAAIDWWSVSADRRGVEYWFKPLTLMLLTALAITVDHHNDTGLAVKVFFVVALLLSLTGDILLMLPKEAFLGGLGAFLGAHLAYIGGLVIAGPRLGWWVGGFVLMAVALAIVGRRILAGAAAKDPAMKVPVGLYIGVIATMVATAIGTAVPLAIIGALLFMVSDALLGANRFLGDLPGGRVAVHLTYHLGQIALVLAIPALTG